MRKKNVRFNCIILSSMLAVLLAVVLCCVFLFSSEVFTADAASVGDTTRVWTEDGYTDPVNDLSYDSSFSLDDYPRDDSDYNLYVIQLAESEDNEVYLYVYQPYGSTKYDLTALRVSMTNGSTYLDGEGEFVGTYYNYSLTCVAYYERIYKYVVNGLTVSSTKDHGYSIASISRAYNANIDGSYTGDNTTSYTAVTVAQYWDVYVLSDGDKVYICTQDDVLEITPYVSWFRITTREKEKIYRCYYEWQQYFFIAFDSDIDIDFLYSADISFSCIKCTLTGKYSNNEFKEPVTVESSSLDDTYVNTPKHITYQDKASKTSKSGKKTVQTFTFDCIKPAPEFLDYVESTVEAETDTKVSYSEMNDDVVQLLQEFQYCIIFSDYAGKVEDDSLSDKNVYGSCELVQDVQIMRLTYSVDDEMYDVGVVSDTVNPNADAKSGGALDIVQENEDAKAEKASRNFWRTFLIVLLVVVIVLVIWYFVKRHRDKKRMEQRWKDKNDRNNRKGGGSGGGGSSLPPPAPPPVDSGGSVPALPSGSSSASALNSVAGAMGSMSSEDVNNLIKAVEVASKFI